MSNARLPTVEQHGDPESVREHAHEREREQSGEPTECPECGGDVAREAERGETVCEECGLVVEEDRIDPGPEWRAFDQRTREKRSRVGSPTTKTMHDEGLSSVIGWRNEDAHGNALDPRKRERMKRLRTWDERFRTKSHRERNLKQALGEIDRMASALSLPEAVRETASVIYRRALEEDLLPGRSIEAVSTAALYAAVRQTDTPRSLAEVTGVSRVDPQEVKRAYRYVVRELTLEVDPTGAEEFLPRFAADLDASNAVERRARELLRVGREQAVHSGKSPVGLAGAALYAAGRLINEPITQADVSEVVGVSEVTVRNRYKELLAAADEPVPG